MRLHGELASAIRIHVVRLCVAFGVSHVVGGLGRAMLHPWEFLRGPPQCHRKPTGNQVLLGDY